MGALTIGALMLIISYSTASTPKDVPDTTHIVTMGFPSLDECITTMKNAPLDPSEVEREKEQNIRTLRLCTVPFANIYYTWKDGHVTATPPNVFIESGPMSPHQL